VTDHGNGTYTAIFTATTAGTARQISATIAGKPVTTPLPTITVTPAASATADLSITIAGPTSVAAGATLNYTITVTNLGPSTSATGYTITDVLPTGLTAVATSGETISGQKITIVRAASLAAGQSRIYVVAVTVSSKLTKGSILKNSASVATRGTVDPVMSDNVSKVISTTIA
jgi:uncharacterized repeat protein (TIGR01451 family)